jgi:AcrR family transcriptional regulator
VSAPHAQGRDDARRDLDVALELASRDGLEGLTIGLLADRMNMSKSGVFAHFGSREDLQIEVLKLYHHRFEQEVFFPSVQGSRAACRAWKRCSTRWVKRVSVEIASGCIYISGAVEYDDRPGPIREKLVGMVRPGRAPCCAACSRPSTAAT